MSDGVQIALIAGFATTVGPVLLAVVNHYLNKRDRKLADETVESKNRQIRLLEQKIEDRDALIAALRDENRALMAGRT